MDFKDQSEKQTRRRPSVSLKRASMNTQQSSEKDGVPALPAHYHWPNTDPLGDDPPKLRRDGSVTKRWWYGLIVVGVVIILVIPFAVFAALRSHKTSLTIGLKPTATLATIATKSPRPTATTVPAAVKTVATIAPNPTPTATIGVGLSGYWKFDEGNGTIANDSSGNGNTGTLKGGLTWAAGKTGRALRFNGVNGEVDINRAVANPQGDFTVTAWVQLSNTNTFATAVSQDGKNGSLFYLEYLPASESNGVNAFSFTVITSDTLSATIIRDAAPTSPVAGVWYHLVGVRDAAHQQLELYINGVLVATKPMPAINWPSSGPTIIGRCISVSKPSGFWLGDIDDVRVYNRALSSQEVMELVTTPHA